MEPREFRPYSKRVNPNNIDVRERKDIKTGIRLSIPYMLLLKSGETYKIRLPKNKEKEHELRVINRVHYDGQNLVNWFGLFISILLEEALELANDDIEQVFAQALTAYYQIMDEDGVPDSLNLNAIKQIENHQSLKLDSVQIKRKNYLI